MEGIFFSTNISHKCFLRKACGKQVSGERRLLGTYIEAPIVYWAPLSGT